MKLISFSLFITIFISFCGVKQKEEKMLTEKATYFDSLGWKTFNGYQLYAIRGGKNSSYEVMKIGSPKNYAVIRLNPHPEIEKNFVEDTITIDFVNTFSPLNCYYLVCNDSFARIDFKTKNNTYTLFSGKPVPERYLPEHVSKAVKLNKRWAFFKYARHK